VRTRPEPHLSRKNDLYSIIDTRDVQTVIIEIEMESRSFRENINTQ